MVAPSLLLEWIIARAEAFVNALLVHAQDIEPLFLPLHHKRVRFIFEPMKIVIEMDIRGTQISLSTRTDRPVFLTLTATPIQFLQTLSTQSVSDLHIEGDGKIAQALQRAINGLHIDIESFLEGIVGATLAHNLMVGMQRAHQSGAAIIKHTKHDLSDYCHYEIQAAASADECDAFAKEVNALRYAVDHLSSKVNQLKRRLEVNHVS